MVSKLKHVVYLSHSCSAITDDGLAAVASGCKKIRMLNLCYCTQITDAGLKHVSALEELTNLELRCLVRITGIGITSIAIGCTSLIELDLKRCYSVDDAGLWALSRYSQNLRQVKNSTTSSSPFVICEASGTLQVAVRFVCSLLSPTVKSLAWACAICWAH